MPDCQRVLEEHFARGSGIFVFFFLLFLSQHVCTQLIEVTGHKMRNYRISANTYVNNLGKICVYSYQKKTGLVDCEKKKKKNVAQAHKNICPKIKKHINLEILRSFLMPCLGFWFERTRKKKYNRFKYFNMLLETVIV